MIASLHFTHAAATAAHRSKLLPTELPLACRQSLSWQATVGNPVYSSLRHEFEANLWDTPDRRDGAYSESRSDRRARRRT